MLIKLPSLLTLAIRISTARGSSRAEDFQLPACTTRPSGPRGSLVLTNGGNSTPSNAAPASPRALVCPRVLDGPGRPGALDAHVRARPVARPDALAAAVRRVDGGARAELQRPLCAARGDSTATTFAPVAAPTMTAELAGRAEDLGRQPDVSPARRRPCWTTARNAVVKRHPRAAATRTRRCPAARAGLRSRRQPTPLCEAPRLRESRLLLPLAYRRAAAIALAAASAREDEWRRDGVVNSAPIGSSTPAPRSTTTPDTSCPGVNGSPCAITSPSWPFQPCQSLRQTPVARTSSTTPPGGAIGRGTSSTAMGPPNSW